MYVATTCEKKDSGAFTGRRFLIAILAVLAMLVVAPAVSQAASGLSPSTSNVTINGATVNFGTNAQGNLPATQTIYFWTTEASGGFANLSTKRLDVDVDLSNSAYERNGGSCETQTPGGGYDFRARISWQGGGSTNRRCSIDLRLKAGTAIGVQNGTLTFQQTGTSWGGSSTTAGSASLEGKVTEVNGAVSRVRGPGNVSGSFDFEQVAIGDSSTRTFTVSNPGTVDFTTLSSALNGASTSYSIVATTCGATLPLYASCTIQVKFEPTSASGPEAKTLDITTTPLAPSSITLSGEGQIPINDFTVTPMAWDYGDSPVGYPMSRSFTVANTGNTTLDLDFDLDPGTDALTFPQTGGTCGATLNVNASCTYIVQFDPQADGPPDVKTGSFTVTGTTFLIPTPETRSVSLTGERVPLTTSIEIRDTAATSVKTSHDYGSISLGSNNDYTFNLRNTGNIPISGLNVALSGSAASSYSIVGNNCPGTLARDTNCQITVRANTARAGLRRATLTVTPAPAPNQAGPKSVQLTAQGTGVRIMNDITDNIANTGSQKRWLESISLAPGGTIQSDIVRVAFEVDIGTAAEIEGVDIVGNTTTNDTPPNSGYQNITDLTLGKVDIQRKPGSNQALVRAEVPLNATNMGVSNGSYGFSTGTDLIFTCLGGSFENTNRRVWFRVRGSDGSTSATVGSVVRFHNQQFACPFNQGGNISNQRILSVGGTPLPSGTNDAIAAKNEPATFQFNTRTYVQGAAGSPSRNGRVDGINWRIRNGKTGDMFRIVNGSYAACADPCTNDANYTQGGRFQFADNAAGVKVLEIPGIPSRGRWIVEGATQGDDENDDSFFNIGTLRVNDRSGTSPTLTFGGTLGARPDSNADYSISANVADPADPVNGYDSQGGLAQVIEWDLDGDTTNGADGEGFEYRAESDSSQNLTADDLVQQFSTTGKTPGPFQIRARVTDNGASLASEDVAVSRIFVFDTTINSLPEPVSETVYIESDDNNPSDVEFRATDADDDPYRVAITPNGGNDGSLGGNLNGPIGDNTKPYSWPGTYTGTDTFAFVPTDDKNGTGTGGTLTVTVRPDTTIDTSTIAGSLLNPDLADPNKRFLGSTTTTSADFDFSSPQTPVNEYECRLLNDGDVVEDWTTCAEDIDGSIGYTDLEDGLHRFEVRAINDDGDADGTPAFRTWRIDNTAPVTEVRIGPDSNLPNQQPRMTNDTTPSYIFRATADERSLQEYITYECRVLFGPESGMWQACGAPADSQGSAVVDIVGPTPDFGLTDPLDEGTYEIEVRGTDEVGNLGPVLLETFTVDTTPPITALASGPEGLVNTRDLEYVLSSTEGQSTFFCKVERVEPDTSLTEIIANGPCPSPAADGSRPTFTVPTDGNYILTAYAIDPATNPDPTPLEVEFEVDATEPTTTMDALVDYGSGPTLARRTQSRKVDVTFTGADTRQLSGFQCRIDSTDDNDWNLCQSVQRFSGLADGDHKVEIRSRDEAGNFDSTPEVLEWTVDRTPPVTTIDVSPAPVDNNSTPSIEFSVNEGATSECRLDGGPWSACTSPVAVDSLNSGNPLSDGPHAFSVRSTDIAGNVELTTASATWEIDTIVPVVEFTSTPNEFVPQGDVDFGWSVKDGNPLSNAPEADAECSYDADPFESCGRDLSISDPANGPHTLIVRATDQAGNISQEVDYTFEVLGEPPVVPVINNSDPVEGATTRLGSARIAFSHPDENEGSFGGFECRIDAGPWGACESPYEADGLGDGAHAFQVRARDIADNISEAATVNWEVQAGAPVTTIESGPNGLTKQKNAEVTFSSNKAGTFECRIDGAAWAVCESPLAFTDLAEGAHSVTVRAVSSVTPVGVKDPTPATRNWTVDSIAPDVTINSAPSGAVVSSTAQLTFSSTDGDATFQCKVGTGLYDACSSPFNLTGLQAGEIVVLVRAVDAAGNVSATPAQALWAVQDPTCPEDFEGTPPGCSPIPPVEGSDINAKLTGGELSLASLGAVELPADQVNLNGVRGDDGRWYVPKEDVDFQTVVQSIPDVLGPGTNVDVEISISATGAGRGTLPSGGGAATFRLPVRADVQAKLGPISVIAPGTECALKPVVFDLTGTYDEAGKSVSLTSPSISFPKITGCDSFKETIDSLLELPRNDISMTLDFALTQVEEEVCPPNTTGIFPNCVEIPVPKAALAKPTAKSPKKVKSGKPVTITARVANTGDAAASNVKVCLTVKKAKKLAKGKAKRCKTVKSIAAGATGVAKFKVKTRKIKAKKVRLNYSIGATAAGVTKSPAHRGHVTVLK